MKSATLADLLGDADRTPTDKLPVIEFFFLDEGR
jgi:hypothetical protein